MLDLVKVKAAELKAGIAASLVIATVGAHAQSSGTVDTSAITACLTDIAAVGVAVFGVYVGIKLYKWIRRAL